MAAFLSDFLLVANAVVLVVFVGFPLVVYAQLRFNRYPRFSILPPEMVPPEAQARFAAAAPGLAACGFVHRTDIGIGGLVGAMGAVQSLWHHPGLGQWAAVVVIYRRPGAVSLIFVEFSTVLADGMCIETTNARSAGAYKKVQQRDVQYLVPTWDVPTLHRVHCWREQRLASPGLARYLPAPGDDAQAVLDANDAVLARQVAVGYLVAGKRAYRPTLIGAFLMSWKQIPGIRHVRAAAIRHRARLAMRSAMAQPVPMEPAAITHDSPLHAGLAFPVILNTAP